MKNKSIIFATLFVLLSPLSVFASGSWTPSTFSYTGPSFEVNTSALETLCLYTPTGDGAVGSLSSGAGDYTYSSWDNFTGFSDSTYHIEGVWHAVLMVDTGTCPSVYTDALSDGNYLGTDIPLNISAVSAPVVSALGTQIQDANASMQATTGFDISAVVTWSGDNLIKLFIGSGLAVLYSLRGWIVALIMIGAVVYFSYRGLRFFRH